MNPPRWNWVWLLILWATGVLFWTLAAARGLGEPALHALPFGITQMAVAALLAVGVWYLTGAVPSVWNMPFVMHSTFNRRASPRPVTIGRWPPPIAPMA